jgi:hypothetical protein
VFVSYYKALFTLANPQAIKECTSAVERNVTPAMASILLSTFSVEEVAATLKQMVPLKAPGPDGYTAGFYQQHWVTMGSEVCEVVLHFFLIPLL